MEVLHTAFIIKAKMDFENADLEDVSKRNTYAQKPQQQLYLSLKQNMEIFLNQ
jgi:hypothetical protein